MYVAEVRIELKPGVADPEGANTKKALELLGFGGVKAVKSVHAFHIELDAKSAKDAEAQVGEMCKRLLVNPVIHAPRVTIGGANGAAKTPARQATRKAATVGRVTAAKAKATTQKKASKAAKRATATRAATERAGAKGKAAKKGGKAPAKKAAKKTAKGKARRGGR